ncbi:hypothetical protein E0485_15025 [Paenibacillus albiflavus]|uniref:Uncharacterized protein n=1 Tax=Paenibacillus albiflavus TaxID=2545760 RepID=A0A4R4EDB3_9BACL|nr:hypothetical protein [Paenibacillus albiflavus]TCZ76151.1 hypothetical protein E0485_15025 [Paenibacillus albiflavus]
MAKTKRKQLRLGTETVVSRKDPSIVLGHRPEDFPQLVIKCALLIKNLETGQTWKVADPIESVKQLEPVKACVS